jgi:hypothetical protein
MPPLPELQGPVGDHRVFNGEVDLVWTDIAELNTAHVAGIDVIKAIVAASGETRAIAQRTALTMAGLGFAGCAKATPHLHRFNPLDIAGCRGQTQLQHVVGRARALVGPFGAIAIDTRARFTQEPLAAMG